jgi:DNA-binding GntR family transcriptional regulator
MPGWPDPPPAADGSPRAAAAGEIGLRRLDTASLRERARDAIRASIVSGDLVPDTVYSVASLAQRLGVSATPIREALFDLGSEGLVEVLPKRGLRVPRLSDTDLDEITALRLMLEVPPVAQLATEGVAGPVLDRLAAIAEQTVAAALAGDIVGFLTADKAFHAGLLELAGNRRLLDLVGRLRDQSRLYGLGGLRASGALARSAAEHAGILLAVRRRDPAAAARQMEHHLRHTRGLWAGRGEEET